MSDKIRFFSGSRHARALRGIGEIDTTDGRGYRELDKHKDWRRVLSNFHLHPFKYGMFTYRSIEHAFQSMKFLTCGEKDAAFKFTMESGHDICRGDGKVARANRKLVLLNADQLAKWDAISFETMGKIAEAKYASDSYAREILRLTGRAQLWHAGLRGAPDVRFTHLERIRESLL
jgi:predicted NAD-dependent protein-ADP-ribosyltransferase YbiA (DUF1768 family)